MGAALFSMFGLVAGLVILGFWYSLSLVFGIVGPDGNQVNGVVLGMGCLGLASGFIMFLVYD